MVTLMLKVEDLKKGKNRVLEKRHTLVLGWNSKIYSFLDNLAIANESENGGTCVILAGAGPCLFESYLFRRCV
jgi:hypothetical protein